MDAECPPEQNNPAAGAASVGGKRGIDLVHDPVLNKATAYTEAERQALGLVGLVPDVTESEDLQLRRVLQQLADKPTDLERYICLISLLDNDETLFYRTLMSDPARFLPVVYDPTIAEACSSATSTAGPAACTCPSRARATSRRCCATGRSRTCGPSA